MITSSPARGLGETGLLPVDGASASVPQGGCGTGVISQKAVSEELQTNALPLFGTTIRPSGPPVLALLSAARVVFEWAEGLKRAP
jgi:hypothetical protein